MGTLWMEGLPCSEVVVIYFPQNTDFNMIHIYKTLQIVGQKWTFHNCIKNEMCKVFDGVKYTNKQYMVRAKLEW